MLPLSEGFLLLLQYGLTVDLSRLGVKTIHDRLIGDNDIFGPIVCKFLVSIWIHKVDKPVEQIDFCLLGRGFSNAP